MPSITANIRLAQRGNSDVNLLDHEVEVGETGFGAVAVVRAAGFGPRFVDRAVAVFQKQRARQVQRGSLAAGAPGVGRAVCRHPLNRLVEFGRRKIGLDVFRRDQDFVGLYSDGHVAAGAAARAARDGRFCRVPQVPTQSSPESKTLVRGPDRGEQARRPGYARRAQAFSAPSHRS